MAIDREKFFTSIREHLGSLTQGQVDGFNAIIETFETHSFTDIRWLAYMLATAWHETAFTMQPIKEYGSADYLRSKPYFPYYGRGYVQLTWKYNYEKYGIADHPEKALEPSLAAFIMIDGMTKGIFTGKKLSTYFNDSVTDPVDARRIINGLDKAHEIAGYFITFAKGLS